MSGGSGSADRRAVCAGCGCLCDDLPLAAPPYERGRPHVETDCAVGRDWFTSRIFGRSLEAGPPEVAGEPTDLAAAAARAAELLASARHPLVAGIGRLPLEGQRRMVEVADRIGADLDLDAADDGLATHLAVHRDGGPFVTLGEVRDRADCLVLWRLRPGRTHPRLLERFYPARGGGERTLVAVGPAADETGADLSVTVDPGDALRLLWLLRLLADDPDAPERESDPLGRRAGGLMEHLEAARWGAWLYPGGGPGGGCGPVEVIGILRLLARLGGDVPWGARPVRGEGNPVGAETVTTWQTGYPGPVTFRDGVPRYDGGGAGRNRTGVDVVLLAGGRPGSPALPDGAAVVWLDAGDPGDGGRDAAGGGPAADVRVPVLPAGAVEGDTLLRMDGLAVRSPGVPGAGDRAAVPATEALGAILEALSGGGRETAGGAGDPGEAAS